MQRKRKLIEQGYCWAEFIGPIRQILVRDFRKVDQPFVLTMVAYTLACTRPLPELHPAIG